MQTPHYVKGHGLLTNKTVLITAAAGSGIGFAAAKKAAEEGCKHLIISDIHPQRIEEAVARIKQETPLQSVFGFSCDVTQQDQVDELIDYAIRTTGGVDVLINNAGLGGSTKLVEMTDQQWHKVIDVSLTGTMRMMRAILPHMSERQTGVIINNASVLGWRAQQEQSHYAAAKAGVMALTRCVAMEAAESNVRINAVSPSIAMHDFLKKSAPETLLKHLSEKEAFGRAAEVWEIANVMMFLASDYSSYMTGEVVSVSSQRA
ncbi:SDR family oxidoreductase [Thalassotalea ponticola]|uniref:SDR family oxidoreductase n=1 Tax=Thalassotalea ponticola TaxID=1523392 RepID=UPI0025B3ED26|nr:SDR family oxidoreductase [Thalassotalea ponticola]MDN3653796.1 SDR family oxidoreductase [Thalassotalea ponticola]